MLILNSLLDHLHDGEKKNEKPFCCYILQLCELVLSFTTSELEIGIDREIDMLEEQQVNSDQLKSDIWNSACCFGRVM